MGLKEQKKKQKTENIPRFKKLKNPVKSYTTISVNKLDARAYLRLFIDL